MKKRSEHFFSKDEMARLRDAIQKVEKKTSGEIVMMVVDESDQYHDAVVAGAVVSGAILSLIIGAVASSIIQHFTSWTDGSSLLSSFFPHLFMMNVWVFIALSVLFYFPSVYLLHSVPALKALLVNRTRREETVRERAVRVFYEKGLYRTRDETGVLIFISILEHRVWILGDSGIDKKIPEGFWKARADALSKGIRDSRHFEATLDVLEKCGEELSKHFPVKKDDTNELPDNVIV